MSSLNNCVVCDNDGMKKKTLCFTSSCKKAKYTHEKIYKRSALSSSHHLYHKKKFVTSRMLGEASCPKRFSAAGGPGNLTRAIQKKGGLFSLGYSKRSIKGRLAHLGNSNGGLDKKHNSYNRYLARKVGNVLRNDKIKFETTDYSTMKKIRCANVDCSQHKCLVERMPNCSDTSKITGSKGNPAVAVSSSSCGCCVKI